MIEYYNSTEERRTKISENSNRLLNDDYIDRNGESTVYTKYKGQFIFKDEDGNPYTKIIIEDGEEIQIYDPSIMRGRLTFAEGPDISEIKSNKIKELNLWIEQKRANGYTSENYKSSSNETINLAIDENDQNSLAKLEQLISSAIVNKQLAKDNLINIRDKQGKLHLIIAEAVSPLITEYGLYVYKIWESYSEYLQRIESAESIEDLESLVIIDPLSEDLQQRGNKK